MMMPAALEATKQNRMLNDQRRYAVSPDTPGLPSLGAVPVLVAGAAVGGAAALKGGQMAIEAATPWYEALGQWIGWRDNPQLPIPADSPAYRAPVAPQTRDAMVNWSDTLMAESQEQRNRQYAAGLTYYRSLADGAEIESRAGSPVLTPNTAGVPVWLYAGIGAVALLVLLKRR